MYELKTLAVYSPGSHLEAVSLWLFLDQVAGQVPKVSQKAFTLFPTGQRGGRGVGAWEGDHVPNYHTMGKKGRIILYGIGVIIQRKVFYLILGISGTQDSLGLGQNQAPLLSAYAHM